MIDENSSLEDVCFEVSSALERCGIEAVLTGGSAATVYAPNAYQSLDADFIIVGYSEQARLEEALRSVGYEPSGASGTFEHARSGFTVDFPRGPLAVGGDYISETAILKKGKHSLRILSVMDCIRDRLAAYYHWNDYTSLNAAVGVAKAHRDRVDILALQKWTQRESAGEATDYEGKLREFVLRLG